MTQETRVGTAMTEPGEGGALPWRFDNLRALFINCTLKRSPERSHTQGLIDRSAGIMQKQGVAVDVLRAVDHDIATGGCSPPTSWCSPGRSGWATTVR